jgi:hypothetical protein
LNLALEEMAMNRRKFLQLSAGTLAAIGAAKQSRGQQSAQQQPPAQRQPQGQQRGMGLPPSTNPSDLARMAKLGSRNVRIHDPSTIIKCNDEYWIFFTGAGVRSYRSKDLITWTAGPQVFNEAPKWAAEAVPGTRGIYY